MYIIYYVLIAAADTTALESDFLLFVVFFLKIYLFNFW